MVQEITPNWTYLPHLPGYWCRDCGTMVGISEALKCTCPKMTPDQFREKLGLAPGKIFVNARGEFADLIEVRKDTVIFKLITSGSLREVPMDKVKVRPE